jgi:hypothetical protein
VSNTKLPRYIVRPTAHAFVYQVWDRLKSKPISGYVAADDAAKTAARLNANP